ncbi:MAG: hypothetical protein QM718_14620 [Steroidobacteraceae bacterium]
MNNKLTTHHRHRWLIGLIAVGMASLSSAQIEKLSDSERKLERPGPPKNSAGNGAQPGADPRDFSGSWRVDMGLGGGGPPNDGGGPGGPPGNAGGPPVGAGGPPGGAGGAPPGGGAPNQGGNPDLNPAGNNGAAGQLPSRILCMPQEPLYTGVDGPTTITQTPELINWSSEEMHHHRRIYLTGSLPKNPTPSYGGVSVGHWDGNTLIVETVGINSQKTGTTMLERWTKNDDKKQLHIAVSYLDADGTKRSGRDVTLNWANGLETLEWFCEDNNEEWLPGGAAYKDQLGKTN